MLQENEGTISTQDQPTGSDIFVSDRKPAQSGVYSCLTCTPASIATNSACASAISGISGVGEKPSSAGARIAWASTGRAVDQ